MDITKTDSNIAKGLAIIMIAIHNLVHSDSFLLTPENEMSFNVENSRLVVSEIFHPSFHLIGEFFSFLGWIGVPLFVFISGYGLAKKYGTDKAKIDSKEFLRYNYLKLFILMLPGVLFYTLGFIKEQSWADVANSLGSLSMMGNLWFMLKRINPGIYWYFGLTFQLYIVFLCFVKRGSMRSLVTLSIVSLLLIPILHIVGGTTTEILPFYRRQFLGWLPIFVIGIICAINSGENGSVFERYKKRISGGGVFIDSQYVNNGAVGIFNVYNELECFCLDFRSVRSIVILLFGNFFCGKL